VKKGEKGVALIMVLWVIAILSVVVLEFSFGMRTEANLAKNFKEEASLYALADGGLQRAIVELIYKHDSRIQQKRKAMKIEEIPPGKEEWITDGRPNTLSFNLGKCEVRILGEDGKININTVSETLLRKIIGNMGLEGEARDVAVDSILDWRDPDDFYRINGAENDYYQSLPNPYECKNRNLDTIEELLLVKGVTLDLFHGKRKKEEDGKSEKVGLKDIFSIYASGEQIDINSASPLVMRMSLGIPKDVAQLIVKAREEKKIENQPDLIRRVPEMTSFMGEIGRWIVYQPRRAYYTIESKAIGQGEAVRSLKAIVKIDAREKRGYKFIQWIDAVW
jgi:general secretion pathway protein K